MNKCFVFLALALMLIISVPAFAGTKTLSFTWSQEITTDFAGWKLYRATAPNVAAIPANLVATITYGGSQQVEYTSEQPMTSPDGQEVTYYFVLTAFDNAGNESLPSNEVSAKVDFQAPNIPLQFKIRIVGN